METKTCTKCGIEKDISLFRKINKVNKKGEEYIYITTHCKKCINKDRKKTQMKDMDKYREKMRIKMAKTRKRISLDPERSKKYKDKRRDWMIQHRYGITSDKFNELSLIQENKCIICGNEVSLLFIDHCHLTNRVRGLLCDQCNIGLGAFKDNVEILEKAIEYLKDPPLYNQVLS